MNPSIQKLALIANKKQKTIIGLMSGTSLDGLDVALCQLSGHGQESQLLLQEFITMDYPDEFRTWIREIFAKRNIDQQTLCGLNPYIGIVHAELILAALNKWGVDPGSIDAIASHGQTVFHAPVSLTGDKFLPNSTLQLGDGDHIAVKTGIITLSDFRQKHLAAGAEGAPLAAYGDYLLFSDPHENRFLLNIGGISNFTFLPKRGSSFMAYATDLGPGNTIMNQYMFSTLAKEMDQDAQLALMGEIQQGLLEHLMQAEFLSLEFPKTTGPELFNLTYLNKALEACGLKDLRPQDIMATLNAFSAKVMVEGIRKAATQAQINDFSIYVSGGGLHNPMLINQIRDAFGEKVYSFEKLGLNPDAKEACLFAILANETLSGTPENVTNIKNSPAVCMGKISLPY